MANRSVKPGFLFLTVNPDLLIQEIQKLRLSSGSKPKKGLFLLTHGMGQIGKIMRKIQLTNIYNQQGYSILAVRILPGACPNLGIWGSGKKFKKDLILIDVLRIFWSIILFNDFLDS
jgi:hypothetical protein